MLRRPLTLCAAAALVALLHVPSLAAPEALLEFHDPSIVEDVSGTYVFSTGPGILVRRSVDLDRWTNLDPVFEGVPSWAQAVAPGQKDLWAPDISHFGGVYHLYYSISTFGSNRSAIGHATNRTLDPSRDEFAWRDHGMVLESTPGKTDWNAIDPHVGFDGSGAPWLFWGSFFSGIKAGRLDPRNGRLAEGARILSIAARPHPGAVEAPFVVRRGGHFYLFLSFDFCCRGAASDYRMVVGRSVRIEGPYIDRSGRALLSGGGTPIAAGYGRWRGPGHCSVLQRPGEDLLVHHAYDANDGGKPRLRVRPLVWMPDGWPHAGEVADRERWSAPGEPPSVTGAWMHGVDESLPTRVIFHPDRALGRRDGPNRWMQDGRRLILAWPRADAPGGEWVDECLLSPDGCRYVGRNNLGMIIRGWRLADDLPR